MKQPVSRNSFDRLRGYLGVYLQEGAPFVDACWNEGSDIHASLLRDAARDAGLDGTAGIELRVDPVLHADGSLKNLSLRGGPGRFYSGGLPVLWPESRLIDAQGVDQEPLLPPRRWLSKLERDVPHTVYVQAWLETEDALDRPDLDDPGIGVERGSFRTRVCSRVLLDKQMPAAAETNLLLTVQGSYTSDVNVLYRVELVDLIRQKGEPVASILWDSAAGAVVAKVTERADAAAVKVLLSRTDGFEVGSYVRFEGARVDGTIYEIVDRDATSITVQGYSITRPPLSMAHFHGHSVTEVGADLVLVVLDELGSNGPSATIPKGSRVNALPADLAVSRPASTWLVTEVVVEGGSLAEYNGISIQQQSYDQLVLAVQGDFGPEGLFAAFPPGTRIRELPANLAASVTRRPWLVVDVRAESGGARFTLSPLETVETTFTLSPNGLVEALEPWNEAFATNLALPAHSFDVCVEVDVRPEWTEGMRVRIFAEVEREPRPMLEFIDTESGRACLPGKEKASFYEDRTIARIIRHDTPGKPAATMTLRFDQPLTYDHARADRVVPEHLIKARRYSGHACVPIDSLDRSVTPSAQELYGPYSLEGGYALPSGLALRLSVETAPGAQLEPVVVAGDGWTFAARAGGWVEPRVFAPVERTPWGQSPLATLTLRENGFELIDVRPVPASHAQHGWLETIRTAAEEIAIALGDHPDPTASRIADVARHPRVQVNLVSLIDVLVVGLPLWLTDDPRCQRALGALADATHAVTGHEDLLADAELSRIAVAMERFSLAVALVKQCGRSDEKARPKPEAPPEHDGSRPWPAEGGSPLPPEEKALDLFHFVAGDVPEPPPVAEPVPEPVADTAAPDWERPEPEVKPAEPAWERPEPVGEAVEGALERPDLDVQPAEPAWERPEPVGEAIEVAPDRIELVTETIEVAPDRIELVTETIEVAPDRIELVTETIEVAPDRLEPIGAAIQAALESVVDAVEAVFEGSETADSGEPAEVMRAPAPDVETADVAPLDPATLPVRLLRQSRGAGSPRRNWVTLGDVPAPPAVSRERERRVAEVVATLLDQTAAIGAKAVSRPGDRAMLQDALDELWKARFHVEQLGRTLTVDDAIAFCTSRSRSTGEES